MGMMTYMRRLDTHANNIANAQTTGFKADFLTTKPIANHTMYRQDDGGRTGIGNEDYAVMSARVYSKLQPGAMQITNSPTDLMLEDGMEGNTSFFVVEQNGESMLTRNGHFGVNEEGYLKTETGSYVLDVNNNHIQVPSGTKVGVTAEGYLYDVNTGKNIAQLQTRSVSAAASDQLVKHENAGFTLDGMQIGNLPSGTAKVHNYMLEASNVDMTKEMAEVMTNQRSIQASQRIMTSFDKIYEKEANELVK